MLTNFLEHTRCPEELVEAFLAEYRATSATEPTSDEKKRPLERIESLLSSLKDSARLQSGNGLKAGALRRTLEFDEAINDVRNERYVENLAASGSPSTDQSLVRKFYYFLRPLFPVAFRKHLQRIALRGWDRIPFPSWPIDLTTETLIEATWELLLQSQERDELPFIWFWPEGHTSGCIMTHDVETAVGRDFCKTMMDMENRRGIRSAFEVVPEVRYEVPPSYLQEIRDAGCEVCLHGLNHDGHLFSSESIFLERAKKIAAYARQWGAVGFRSPVMYRNLAWLPSLEFSYDMSVPNVAHLDPQRGGCCTVMPYFIGNLLELPLTTTQDYTLFNILQQRSLDLWKKQIAMIREKHGLISFIIHPDYVTESWSTQIYDQLLGYLEELRANHGVWIALPKQIDTWWRARREMRLVRQDGAWQIVGPQAERARIAFASMQDGRINYRVEKANPVASVQ